eukprot:Sspe_Gene.3849::Locus_1282_Transcript_1_1_Confidence_1.000_Length_1047::g.3849::m.3849
MSSQRSSRTSSSSRLTSMSTKGSPGTRRLTASRTAPSTLGGRKIKGLGGMKLSAESLEATLNDLMKADASGSATPAAPKQQPSGTHISSKPFDANEVVFNDPKSGNELRFTIDGNAIKYSVNGEPRPPFKQVVSNGADGLLFKDIGKGCGVPSAKERQLLLRLALKAGIEVAGFPDSDYSLPEEKKEQRTDTSIDSVQFEDAGSGNKLRFLAERNAISYTVNGKERPAFRVIIFDGESRLRFDDIGKGCVLPADRRDEILKAFKSMAARVGATIKGF